MKSYIFLALRIAIYVCGYFGTAMVLLPLLYGPKAIFKGEAAQSFLIANGFMPWMIIWIVDALLIWGIYKIRKIDFMKASRVKKISLDRAAMLVFIGIAMSFFTIALINTSYIYKTFPQLENTLTFLMESNTMILFPLIWCTVMPFFEELVLRGAIFNELNEKLPLVVAIAIQAVIYGIMSGNLAVGIYAAVSAVLFVLVYMWFDSVWASALIQIVSLNGGLILRRIGVKDWIVSHSDTGLYLISAVSIALVAVGYVMVYKMRVVREDDPTAELRKAS